MALQICIKLLIIVTLAVIVNCDVTVQSLPLLTHSNFLWNFPKMEYPSAVTVRPTENNFYHSITQHQHSNNYQSNVNTGLNNYNGCKKIGSDRLMNHAYTASTDHPGYPWPGKPIGNSFQFPLQQTSTQAPQYWPSLHQNMNRHYQPPVYVPPVAKIDPPPGYKLWTSQY